MSHPTAWDRTRKHLRVHSRPMLRALISAALLLGACRTAAPPVVSTGDESMPHHFNVFRPHGELMPNVLVSPEQSHVYLLSTNGDLLALDVSSGKPVWTRRAQKDDSGLHPLLSAGELLFVLVHRE